MSGKVVVYHNPRCSKSRETMALLRARGVEPEVVEYLKTPPDAETLRYLLRQLGMRAHDLVRAKEPVYKELGLSPKTPEDALIEAMVAHPVLIERPIVVTEKGAALGRPPEAVQAVL
jgi:arsenate reductase